MKFSEFDLDDQIIQALEEAGYSECMPVQEQTLAHTIKGKDVFVQSQTGTGKTAAFLVSIFALLRGELNGKKALIIAPTRELAVQIEKEAILLGHNLGFNICSFYGGVGYGRQEHHLAQGVDIMIGTPGRILDFKKSGKINFKEIGIFVIDEADRLFDMGFLPDITTMLKSLNTECKVMLFSATLSREVRMIAREYMDNPAEVELCPEKVTVDAITQELYHVSKSEKMNLLLGILKKENPRTALIFTNMKDQARVVAERLRHNGFSCEHLSGDLPQKKRSRIVDEIKEGKISLLIATDVAARGIHIDDLDLVINYDIPEHCENYVHRIGRTARAGKTGKAVSLACEDYVHGLKSVEQFIGFKIPVMFADSELYLQDSSAGISFRKSRHRTPERSSGRTSSRKNYSDRKVNRKPKPGRSSHNENKRLDKIPRPKRHSQQPAQRLSTESRPVEQSSKKKTGWFQKAVIRLFG